MDEVSLKDNKIRLGDRFSVSFERTLRVPDDDQVFPLPPSLGKFEVHPVAEYREHIPNSWEQNNSFFIPMYNREALWLKFNGTSWNPNAIKVGVGNINAVSGEVWDLELRDQPQDYMVCPEQPWLDGINAGEGFIRQFVATILGEGYTIEGQITGSEELGGIQIAVFDPKPGLFPDQPPSTSPSQSHVLSAPPTTKGMGLSAGGRIKQKIYPDPYGIDVWDKESCISIFVYLISCDLYQLITHRNPPLTPIDAKTYTENGFPWFAIYDEHKDDLLASQSLQNVKSLKEQITMRSPSLPLSKSLQGQSKSILYLKQNKGKKMPDNTYEVSKEITWEESQQLGGTQFIYSPSVTSFNEQIQIVGIGRDSKLYTNSYNGENWQDEWKPLDAYHFVYTPAIVAEDLDKIHVFAIRIDDKSIYQFTWNGSQWDDPKDLKARAIYGVAALSIGDDVTGIEIFTVGLDSCVYSNCWNGSQWNGWQNIQVDDKKLISTSAPAVTNNSQGTTYLLTVGVNNEINCIYRKQGSPEWMKQGQEIGYTSLKGVTAVSQENQIGVFASGFVENDNASIDLSSKWWYDKTWDKGFDLKVTSYYPPAAILDAKGKLSIFYVGGNNFVYQKQGLLELKDN